MIPKKGVTIDARARRFLRLAKEPLLTSTVRGNSENRVWAKVIDFALVEAAALIVLIPFPWLAWVLPWLLWSMLDSFGRGQSPGKWLLGLHVIEGQLGRKPNALQGLLRNLPFALLSAALGSSGAWALLFALPGLAWTALDFYFIFNLRSGLRLGDVFAGTRVFDYKDEHTLFVEQFLKESNTP